MNLTRLAATLLALAVPTTAMVPASASSALVPVGRVGTTFSITVPISQSGANDSYQVRLDQVMEAPKYAGQPSAIRLEELKFTVSHKLLYFPGGVGEVDISAQEFVSLVDDQGGAYWSSAVVGDNLTKPPVNCGGFDIFTLGYQRSESGCMLFQVPATAKIADVRWTDSICCVDSPSVEWSLAPTAPSTGAPAPTSPNPVGPLGPVGTTFSLTVPNLPSGDDRSYQVRLDQVVDAPKYAGQPSAIRLVELNFTVSHTVSSDGGMTIWGLLLVSLIDPQGETYWSGQSEAPELNATCSSSEQFYVALGANEPSVSGCMLFQLPTRAKITDVRWADSFRTPASVEWSVAGAVAE